MPQQLKVNEIFYSLQGEGPFSGSAAVIRAFFYGFRILFRSYAEHYHSRKSAQEAEEAYKH